MKKVSPGHASLAIMPHSTTPDNGYVSLAVKSGSVYGTGKFYPYSHDKHEYILQKDGGKVRGAGLAASMVWTSAR